MVVVVCVFKKKEITDCSIGIVDVVIVVLVGSFRLAIGAILVICFVSVMSSIKNNVKTTY